MRFWHLPSICRIQSRTERPRKTKIGTEAAHVTTRTPLSRSKGQRLTCRGWGHIVVASRTVCWVWIRVPSNLCTGRYSVSLGLPQQGVAIAGIRNIRSLEHSFPWWNFRSRDHSFLGTFVPWTVRSKLSFSRLFVPWNIRSLDCSFHGTFVPWNFCSRYLDLSCHGPFVHLSAEQYLVWNSVTNRSVVLWQRPCTASHCTQTVDRKYSATRLNRFSSSECG